MLYETQRRGRARLATLKGWRLSVALPYIRKLAQNSRSHQQVDPTYRVAEEEGIRLALTFLGIRNLMKLEKAENVCRHVHSMSQEEAYYWYAKALGNHQLTLGIRALRTLFGET